MTAELTHRRTHPAKPLEHAVETSIQRHTYHIFVSAINVPNFVPSHACICSSLSDRIFFTLHSQSSLSMRTSRSEGARNANVGLFRFGRRTTAAAAAESVCFSVGWRGEQVLSRLLLTSVRLPLTRAERLGNLKCAPTLRSAAAKALSCIGAGDDESFKKKFFSRTRVVLHLVNILCAAARPLPQDVRILYVH